MATQRITVAKIGGAAGFAVMQSLHDLRSSLETGRDSSRHDGQRAGGPEALKTFVASLRANSSIPPVIFFAEYVDTWSMGDVFQRCFPRRRSPNIVRISHDELEIMGYRLPDGDALQAQGRRLLRTKSVRESAGQEQRWFLSIVLHALDAWNVVVQDGALVIIREVLGGLLEDADVEQALEHVPQWITENARPRSRKRG
jgi:hypothetical protein